MRCCERDTDGDGNCDKHKAVCECGYAVPRGSDGWHDKPLHDLNVELRRRPRCPECEEPVHGKFGPDDRTLCFSHGMAYLAYLKEAQNHYEDCAFHIGEACDMVCDYSCPDGPHCGCPAHGGANVEG